MAFHIVAITVWALPNPPLAMMQGKRKPYGSDWILQLNWKYAKQSPIIQTYDLSTGFWQYWDMFSPDPVQSDVYGTATIIYKHGQTFEYQYPRMYLLPIPQKFLMERYRKFFERVHDYLGNPDDARPFVAQRFAQRIALINDRDPGNPPVEVKLFLHEWPIPPPGKPLTPKYSSVPYFDYIVEQEQLARDKAGPP